MIGHSPATPLLQVMPEAAATVRASAGTPE